MKSQSMDELEETKRKGKLLVQGFDGAVYALASHPSLPLLATGTKSGLLQLWDIEDHTMVLIQG